MFHYLSSKSALKYICCPKQDINIYMIVSNSFSGDFTLFVEKMNHWTSSNINYLFIIDQMFGHWKRLKIVYAMLWMFAGGHDEPSDILVDISVNKTITDWTNVNDLCNYM